MIVVQQEILDAFRYNITVQKLRRLITLETMLAGLAGCTLSFAGLWSSWTRQNPQTIPSAFFLLISVVVSVGVGVLLVIALGFFRRQRLVSEELNRTEKQLSSMTRELNGIRRINRTLTAAQDEKQLVEGALAMIQEVCDAQAVSFVPMDEWGIPLPAYSLGRLPQTVLTAWAEHLTSPRVRQKCHQCQRLHAQAGTKCPVLEGPFSALDVYCLPVKRGELMLGMLNIYLSPSQKLDGEIMDYLNTILKEVAQAVESFRLRARELDLLRFYKKEDQALPELSVQLGDLINDLIPLLEAEAAILQIQPLDAREETQRLQRGSAAGLAALEKWMRQSTQTPGKDSGVELKWQGRFQVDPLTLIDGSPTGELWVMLKDGVEFNERINLRE